MNNEFEWKKFQFITEVQTTLIVNTINLSLREDPKERRHIFSATGTLINMDDAFYAAEQIPKDMSAHEVACEFINFACQNLWEAHNAEVPYWFARH